MTPTHLIYAKEEGEREEEREEEENEIKEENAIDSSLRHKKEEKNGLNFDVFYARDVYEGMKVLVMTSDGTLRAKEACT